MIIKLIIFTMIVFFSIIPSAIATPSMIKMIPENRTYTYGEFLNFEIIVDEVGKNATLYIRDDSDIRVKIPDQILIIEPQTQVIFPYSFFPGGAYKEGKYFLDIEYEGITNSIEFNIINSDSKAISIPDRFLIKEAIDTLTYESEIVSKIINHLINKNLIEIQNIMNDKLIEKWNVPEWIKNNVQWWYEGKISDNDFIQLFQYLIDKKIISFSAEISGKI